MRLDWDTALTPTDVRQSWGDFIQHHANWSWWTTLTFKMPVSKRTAAADFRAWMQLIAREVVRGHFGVAWAVEAHSSAGHHVHALVALPAGSAATAEDLLTLLRRASRRAGRIDLRAYEAGGAAPWYVAKSSACEISVTCPRTHRCKRHGCTQGRWSLP
jgi:hypothetical protein